jgi:hypothetical protein
MAHAERRKIPRIDNRLNETPGVIGGDILSTPWWELERFVAVSAWDVAHRGETLRNRDQSQACPILCQIPEFLHSLRRC